MQKICVNSWCGQSFEVTDEDLAFYDRMSPIIGERKLPIPPPTRCPECRLQRRLSWRNDRTIYRRTCDATEQSTLSIYSPDKPFTVYASGAWWSDSWDPMTFGRSIEFGKPFFEQFAALMAVVPRPALNCEQSENCDYCHNTTFSRNCYLCSATAYCEDCYYDSSMTKCTNVIDCLGIHGSELCAHCINSRNCYRGIALQNCFGCIDCAFCYDCRECRRCIGCVGLVRKELHIGNRPVSAEEFERTRSSMLSYNTCNALRRDFESLALSVPHRNVLHIASENCTGDSIFFSKNARNCFDVENCEDAAYAHHVRNFKDSMDVFGAFMGGELQYENGSAGGSIKTMGAYLSYHNADCCFLNYSHHCSHCFGCIGLRHKKFCILNKQYSQQEYELVVPKIVEQMKHNSEWGEFFPETISPYAYNESAAQDFFPLDKEECTKRGLSWRESREEPPRVEKIIPAEDLPDSTDDIPDDALNWAIVCEKSKRPFKIIPQELKFYREHRLPLPRVHPEVRFMDRMKRRGHGKLWPRQCAKCGKTMETTFAPERPEIVYCESCYLQSVY